MMKKLLCMLLLINNMALRAQHQILLWPNGKVKTSGKITGNFKTGKWKEFYESGELKMKGKYSIGDHNFYDATIGGLYPNGEKWYSIIYSSKEENESATEWFQGGKIKSIITVEFSSKDRTQMILTAQYFDHEGIKVGNQTINISSGLYFFSFSTSDSILTKNLHSTIAPRKLAYGVEIIKTLFFDGHLFSTAVQINELNNWYGNMLWQGKIEIGDKKNRITSDTSYLENRPCYFFDHFYLADTLSYSRTEMGGKSYYIFPESVLQKALGKVRGSMNNDLFPEFINFSQDFPDGIWLMFYPKKYFYDNEMNNYFRWHIGDTTRYQFSPCDFVYFMQEYKNHKPNGAYQEYYFYDNPSQFINNELPIIGDLRNPFQFNILHKDGYYADGKKSGTFNVYLLDGKTVYKIHDYLNDVPDGRSILYFHNDSLTRIIPHYMQYSDCKSNPSGQFDCFVYDLLFYDNPNKNVGGQFYYYEIGNTHNGNKIGVWFRYEDGIENQAAVYNADSMNVATYTRTYFDSSQTKSKVIEYHFGKISRIVIQNGDQVKETKYENGIPIKTEYFRVDKNGIQHKIK